jgi:hypothetical protein
MGFYIGTKSKNRIRLLQSIDYPKVTLLKPVISTLNPLT